VTATTAARFTDKAAELAGGEPVRWDRLTWPRLAAMREAGHDMVLIPVGATEQHGPHLPVNTDSAIAAAACAYASAKTGVPMMPPIAYAVSVGHTEHWPGTVSVMHETFALMLREMCAFLIAGGWRRVLLVNSHFGNDAILRVAVDRMRFDHAEKLQVQSVNTFNLTPAIWDYFTSDGDDIHANKAETDLMLYLDPEAVDMSAVEDDTDRTAGLVFSYLVPRTSTNGVTGRPSEGTAERGRALLTEIGDALSEIVSRARTESAPLPWKRDPARAAVIPR
jgi:creatinine amidohydrolase